MPYANKEEEKKYRQAYYQKNREKQLAAEKERRQNDPEFRMAKAERSSVHYRMNKERILKRQADWYRTNNAAIRVERAAYRAANKHKLRRDSLRWHYNLTPEEWEEIFNKQGRRCAICRCEKNDDKRGRNFHTDHCHATGKVRGILCVKCNLLVGAARDSTANLRAAIRYLKGCRTCESLQ